MMEYFTGLVERRRDDPGEDAVSQLVARGDDVSVLQVLGFAFTMVTGGNDTTTGLLGGALDLLTRHPAQRPAWWTISTRVPDAVEELLRLTTPGAGPGPDHHAGRRGRAARSRAGRRVLLLYAAANRDPDEFGADAEQAARRPGAAADPDLQPRRAPLPGRLRRGLAARVTLEELLARCPDFEVDAEAATYADGSYVRRHTSLPFAPR